MPELELLLTAVQKIKQNNKNYYLKEESLEWFKVSYVGKEAQRMEDSFKLPYTMDGFEVFCYKNYGCVEQYFKNQNGYYDEFVPICSYIKKEIRNNQITGGLLGVYNPSVTQRLNNLKEQTEHSGEVTQTIISLGNGTNPNETTN